MGKKQKRKNKTSKPIEDSPAEHSLASDETSTSQSLSVRKSKPAFVLSAALFSAWTLFLVWVAWRVTF